MRSDQNLTDLLASLGDSLFVCTLLCDSFVVELVLVITLSLKEIYGFLLVKGHMAILLG